MSDLDVKWLRKYFSSEDALDAMEDEINTLEGELCALRERVATLEGGIRERIDDLHGYVRKGVGAPTPADHVAIETADHLRALLDAHDQERDE